MTRGQAITAKCRDCSYDKHSPGTWRQQVAQCTVIRCPLWPLRPMPSSGPFSDAPRDPEAVTQEWLKAPLGCAKTGHPRTLSPKPDPEAA